MSTPSRIIQNTKTIGLFLCALAILYLIWNPSAPDAPASSHLLVSKTMHPARQRLSILFIGNSYTYVNDLPAMLADIASSDPSNDTLLQVQSVTKGGAHLLDLWNEGIAQYYLKSKRWNYVILQEQSEWAMLPAEVKKAYEGSAKFVDAIKRSGAVPLLYETWQRRPGSAWYKDPQTSFLKTPRFMKEMLRYQTINLCNWLNIGVIPAGDKWGAILEKKPDFPLYLGDGSHPSVTGTYLVALVFYHLLVHTDVTSETFVPAGVTQNNANYLRDFVKNYAVAH